MNDHSKAVRAMLLATALAGVFAAEFAQTQVRTQPKIDRSLTVGQALQIIQNEIVNQYDWGKYKISSINVDKDGFAFTEQHKKATWNWVVHFKQIPYFEAPARTGACWSVTLQSQASDSSEPITCWVGQDDAEAFVTAVNRMVWEAHRPEEEAAEAALQDRVAAWQARGSRADLPQEARRHRVLAEQAIRDKDLEHAADEFEAALRIYPTWPEGQFNAALVLGELQRYPEAIEHMRMYLKLVPKAADGPKAQEQIWIWEDKETSGRR